MIIVFVDRSLRDRRGRIEESNAIFKLGDILIVIADSRLLKIFNLFVEKLKESIQY